MQDTELYTSQDVESSEDNFEAHQEYLKDCLEDERLEIARRMGM